MDPLRLLFSGRQQLMQDLSWGMYWSYHVTNFGHLMEFRGAWPVCLHWTCQATSELPVSCSYLCSS